MFPMEWKGKHNSECGKAIFMVEGHKFEITLESFTEALTLGKMLEIAFDSGKAFAAQQVVTSIDRKIQEVRRTFNV